MAEEAIRERNHVYPSSTVKVLARDIQPSQFVSQRELVEVTGMPLGATREMLPRIEADGLIRASPKRGLEALFADPGLILNAFQSRHIVQGEALAEFCETVSGDDLSRIEAEHDAIRRDAVHSVTPKPPDRAHRLGWSLNDQDSANPQHGYADAAENGHVGDVRTTWPLSPRFRPATKRRR